MEQEAITLTVGDGEAGGYMARPEGGGPGILLLHSWWGLNSFFKSLCDRLAEAGFMALAPDLYQGRIAETVDEAEQLMKSGDDELRQQTVRAAADILLAAPGRRGSEVGVVGFSMGAWWAAQLAAQAPEEIGAVVLYYGTVAADFGRSRAAFLGHFGELDEWEPLEGVREMEENMRAAGREATIHFYPRAGHWFCEADRPDAFEPEATDLAWKRTVSFLHEWLD